MMAPSPEDLLSFFSPLLSLLHGSVRLPPSFDFHETERKGHLVWVAGNSNSGLGSDPVFSLTACAQGRPLHLVRWGPEVTVADN